jgi:prefoldin subunit 5
MLDNPVFLVLIGIVALVIIAMNTMIAVAILRGRKDNIDEAFNRDKKAMDELHKRVEELEKKK